MKQKVNLQAAQQKAIDIYAPQKMIKPERLIRIDDHSVYFDKTTIPPEEKSPLFIILALDYQWRYKQNFEDVTPYYEVDSDNNILCGVYDLVNKKKLTKKVLIGELENASYTYTREIMDELVKNILST